MIFAARRKAEMNVSKSVSTLAAQREVSVLTDIETFCLAFKLGAKIMLDVLTEGQIREI